MFSGIEVALYVRCISQMWPSPPCQGQDQGREGVRGPQPKPEVPQKRPAGVPEPSSPEERQSRGKLHQGRTGQEEEGHGQVGQEGVSKRVTRRAESGTNHPSLQK